MSLKYRPEIDGLRSFAIIPVILFHMYPKFLVAGYLGVDVFFVISGYLITGIIVRDLAKGRFSFKEFWLRRARRILPALLAMVLFTLFLGNLLIFPAELKSLGLQGLGAVFSTANIYFWDQSGSYWSHDAENMPLLHTWSLSLEEQFYLFFPLLLAGFSRFFKNSLRPSFYLVAAGVAMSLIVFFWGLHYYPKATFYLLPTRIWELGAGGLLAIYVRKKPINLDSKGAKSLSFIGLLLILSSFIFLPEKLSPYTFITILGTLLVIAYGSRPDSLAYKILAASPVVFVGKLSYSLYLWHWPLLVFARNFYLDGETPIAPWMTIPAIGVCSLLSYYLIEAKTRSSHRVHKPLVAAVVACVLMSVFLINKSSTLDLSLFGDTVWKGELYNIAPSRDSNGEARMKGVMIVRPENYDVQQSLYKSGGVIKDYGETSPQAIVMGDSHSLMWSSLLDRVFKAENISVAFNSANASSLFFEIPVKKTKPQGLFSSDEQMQYNRSRLEKIKQWRPKIAILVMRWSLIQSPEQASDLMELFRDIGTKVLFIEQVPELFFGARNAPAYLAFMGISPQDNSKQYIKANDTEAFKRGRRILGMIANKYDATIIPTLDLYQRQDEVLVLDENKVLYVDYDHLSEAGAAVAEKRIKAAIARALESP